MSPTLEQKGETMMTVAEVARELRCSVTHAYNLINGRVQGVPKLPALVIGRKKVVRRASFEAWKAANEGKSE
jgi:hypothetical protein